MTLEEARDEVKKCDEEIQSIKAALRGIGSANSPEANSLEIEFTKVEGLPETAKPTLKLQLSSPIEEREVSLGGEKAIFESVETSVATLAVDAMDADIPLGASTNPIEVAPLCTLDDPKQPKAEYVTEIPVEIVAPTPATDDKEESEATEAGEAKAEPSICSVTLTVTYKPSSKDQREELYDLLNKTSQRKATALQELRKRSIERARAGAASATEGGKSTAVTRSKPSVKPGFLNKGGKKGDDEDDKTFVSAVKKWYKRVTGPDSIVMKTAFFAVVTKDFWIFFGAVGFMHYRGDRKSVV